MESDKPERPSVLYKYRGVDKNTLCMLLTKSVWFSSPKAFNDPFDCQLFISATEPSREEHEGKLDAEVQRLKGIGKKPLIKKSAIYIKDGFSDKFKESVFKYKAHLEKDINELGVISFSEINDSPTMWGHYADSHKGICLGYKTRGMFARDHIRKHTFKMNYLPDADISFNAYDLYDEMTFYDRENGNQLRVFQKLLSLKTDDWSYEKEWRALMKGEGGLIVENDAIESITFGVKCSSQDKVVIRNIMAGYVYEPVYYQMVKSETSATLERVFIGPESKYWFKSP